MITVICAIIAVTSFTATGFTLHRLFALRRQRLARAHQMMTAQ